METLRSFWSRLGTGFSDPFSFVSIWYVGNGVSHLFVHAIGHGRSGYTPSNFLWLSTRQVCLRCTSILRSYPWTKNSNRERKWLWVQQSEDSSPLISLKWKTVCDFSSWNGKHSRESQNVQIGNISAYSNS